MCTLIGKKDTWFQLPRLQFMVDTSSQTFGPTPDRVVRGFWHGQFSPYEALCL
jgi:hypothetical protein